ncbi:hypothetical protein J6590_039989 [Homalodisca vitripennis]|nr:hypothetical protein J6590_039989 [Homalodisca vitripennis]
MDLQSIIYWVLIVGNPERDNGGDRPPRLATCPPMFGPQHRSRYNFTSGTRWLDNVTYTCASRALGEGTENVLEKGLIGYRHSTVTSSNDNFKELSERFELTVDVAKISIV